MKNTPVHAVSFSGGESSAYLVWLMQQKKQKEGLDVKYIFMDTGAEHPKTYLFIRNIVKHWGIDLICLRVQITPQMRKANRYRVISVDQTGPDLLPFRQSCYKYGLPYPGGAACSRVMKKEVFDHYCKDHFPSFVRWIGIRADEPRRQIPQEGTFYLADISDKEKDDIHQWWGKQPFRLGLSPHLGNCVFCVKKSIKRIALACRDEPEMLVQFLDMIHDPRVRSSPREEQKKRIMYRKHHSLESIIATFSGFTREEIAAPLKIIEDVNDCTESCEPL